MKKYFIGLFAFVLAIGASAFTKVPVAKTSGGYYFDPGSGKIVPLSPHGVCVVADADFCTYDLISGRDDNGDPQNYQGVAGEEGEQWIVLP